MNGFGRIGVPAIAMLASLLLQGQVKLSIIVDTPDNPGSIIPRSLPIDIPPEQVDAVLPIVSDGFASDKHVDGSIAPLVAALHSESYRQREAASRDLLCLPPDRLPDVVQALAEESDEEAISRLKTVAGHLFLKPRTNVRSTPAFMGIGGSDAFVSMLGLKFDDPEKLHVTSTAPAEEGDVVVVRARELQPGFPAAQELREGDLIAAIGGKPFAAEMVPELIATDNLPEDAAFVAGNTNSARRDAAKSMFQTRVRAMRPGSVVTFAVVRDGKLMDVPVQMAAMPLNDGASLSSLVELRNQYMATFVMSLKTGETKSQARGRDLLNGQQGMLSPGHYDWADKPSQPTIFSPYAIYTDWGWAVPVDAELISDRL